MWTNWDTAGDDIEALLDSDELETLCTPHPVHEAVPPQIFSPLRSSDVAGDDSLVPQTTDSRIPSQIPAHKQVKGSEDHDNSVHLSAGRSRQTKSNGSTDEGKKVPTIEHCEISGGRHLMSSSQKVRAADAKREMMRVSAASKFQPVGLHTPESTQRVSRKSSEALPKVQGAGDLARKEEVRVLSCEARDRRPPQASNVGTRSLKGVAAQQPKKRIRQDDEQDCQRRCNDSSQIDERRTDSTPVDVQPVGNRRKLGKSPLGSASSRHASVAQEAAVVGGSKRPLERSPSGAVSSRHPSVHQKAAETRDDHHTLGAEALQRGRSCLSEKENLSTSGLLYRIPGPAGAKQKCVSKQVERAQGLHTNGNVSVGQDGSCGPSFVDMDFRKGSWLAAMEYLNGGGCNSGKQETFSTIVTIKATKSDVHQLVAVIKTATPNGFGSLSVTLQDSTGSINGSIHSRVFTELEDGQLIAAGAVLVLRKVRVFSLTSQIYFINITINNVEQVFAKDAVAPRRKETVANDNLRNTNAYINGRDQSKMQNGLNDKAPVIIEPEEDQSKLGPSVPNIADLEMQGEPKSSSCTQKSSRGVTGSQQIRKSPGSGKMASNSPSLPTKPVEIVSLKEISAGNEVETVNPKNLLQDFDAKVTQEAMAAKAKAAGWDLTEDIELLLDDSFPLPLQ